MGLPGRIPGNAICGVDRLWNDGYDMSSITQLIIIYGPCVHLVINKLHTTPDSH